MMFVVLCSIMFIRTAGAEVILPTIVSHNNTQPYSTATIDKIADNSGMTPAVNTGDTLTSALDAIHIFGGVFESWVTIGSAPDYSESQPAPEIVFDLTGGGDTTAGSIVTNMYSGEILANMSVFV